MTTTERADVRSEAPEPASRPAPGATRSAGDRGLLLSLELVALAAFAFSRPVLSGFGSSPEAFVVRGARGWVVVAFAVAVVLVPALVVTIAGVAVRRIGGRARPWGHPVLVGVLGGVCVWRLGQEVTGWPGDATKLLLAAPLAGLGFVVLRRRVPSSGTFLRYAAAGSIVFLAQFLVASPASGVIFGDGPRLDEDVSSEVTAQLGADPPDVLFVVFDALPLGSLLDGTGRIDAELYPNFAAIAGDGTFYRNNTTVSAFTLDAVPALATGRFPSTNAAIDAGSDDDTNLFTLLGGSYDMHVKEQVTRLCPSDVCVDSDPGGLGPLLRDATDFWTAGVAKGEDDTDFDLPALLAGRVYDDAETWIDGLDLRPGGRPDLVFHHVILPHEPWTVTDDGTFYEGGNPPTGYYVNMWTTSGIEVGRQRHVLQLQAADRLLGRHLDALRAAGMYDDALVVVTADHGAAFAPGTMSRGLTEENFEQVMWTPLLVKAPRQSEPRVDDRDVRSVDVMPTIADLLGVEVPWQVDGEPAGRATDRDGDTRPFDDDEHNGWRADEGDDMLQVPVGDALDRVLATDPVEWTGPDAVWKRTEHGDLFDQAVEGLVVGEPADGSVRVEDLDDLDDVSLDDPLPIEVVGYTDLPSGTVVAYALNGTIGAVSEVEGEQGWEGRLVHGIVPPRLFEDGRNRVDAYLVRGEPGAETLHPLTITDE
jgi:hypothetical protein